MTDSSSMRVDDKAEYAEICAHLRTATTLLWQAFAVFFTINSVLVAAVSFTFPELGKSENAPVWLLAVAVVGCLISVLAIGAVRRFLAFIRPMLQRGRLLEQGGDTDNTGGEQLMTIISRVYQDTRGPTAERMSSTIFVVFAVGWALIGLYALFQFS